MLSRVKRITRPLQKFTRNIKGFGAIEAAITMPIFLGILMGIVDYGMLMTNRVVAASGMSSIVRSIQDNPGMSTTELNALITGAGSGLVNFNASGNCVCTSTFTTQAAADAFAAGTTCTPCPKVTTGTAPYFLATKANFTYNFITPFNQLLGGGSNAKPLHFGQVARIGGNTPPVCNGAGQALQFDGTNWSCVSTQPSTTDCYWTSWFNWWGNLSTIPGDSLPYSGISGDAACAAGFAMMGLSHTDAPRTGGGGNDDEAFRLRCCRIVSVP